jgi:hypothetical protein
VLEFSQIEITDRDMKFDSLKFEYELYEGFKMVKYSSEVVPAEFIQSYKYRRVHSIKDISENTVIHYMEKPVAINIQTIQKIMASDELTSRSSFGETPKSSFACQMDDTEEDTASFMKSGYALVTEFQ